MKKLGLLLSLLLVAALSLGALAEGAERTVRSEAIELTVPEEAEALLPGGAAEDVGHAGETAVSAAEEIAVDAAHFPDPVFRSYVKKELNGGRATMSASTCASVTRIDFEEDEIEGVTDLTGIEWFPNLKSLFCYDSELTSLDVSKNTKLEQLGCDGNHLKILDVSNNTNLEQLWCADNDLTTLDVRKNTKLTDLACDGNELEELDVSKNTRLEFLYCNGNKIPSLDISNCSAILLKAAKNKPKVKSGVAEFRYIGKDEEGYLKIDAGTSLIKAGKQIYPSANIAKATLTVKAQTYTGSKLKPAVTVKLDGKTLKQGTDYTVKYKNNTKIGKATVTVTGTGDYEGTAKASFKINPKKVSGLKLKAGKKQIKVSWKKAGGVTGYQVQYGTKKDFKGAKTATVNKAKTTTKTIKKLKAKKTYYVRIRAYKTVSGKKYYSKWSSAKKVKTK